MFLIFIWFLWPNFLSIHDYGSLKINQMIPRPEAPNPEHILGVHVTPIEGLNDMWADAQMNEVIEYLAGCFSMSLPEDWRSCLPVDRQ